MVTGRHPLKQGLNLGESRSDVYEIWPGETGDFDVIYQGGKQQRVARTGKSYTIEIAHPIYDNIK